MLCKVDYTRSSVREYKDVRTNSMHKFLDVYFVPAQMDVLDSSFDQGSTTYRLQFFPMRNNDNTVNAQHEEALVQLLTSQKMPTKHVGSIEIKVAPHWRAYGASVQGRNPGELIKDELGNNKVFDTVTLSTLMSVAPDGTETPNRQMSYYESRARNLRKSRIEQSDIKGKWYEIQQTTTSTAEPHTDDTSVDDILNSAPELGGAPIF